jgi:hypothetical protein
MIVTIVVAVVGKDIVKRLLVRKKIGFVVEVVVVGIDWGKRLRVK